MTEYREIPIALIERNPDQPRTVFDEVTLAELAESIQAHGVIQPVEVEERCDGRYMLHHGERRLRASKLAGRETIPAIVTERRDAEILLVRGLLENLHREDLNVIDEAKVFRALIREHKWTRTRVARETGRAQSIVAARLAWLELEEPIQRLVALGHIPRDGRLAEALRGLPPEARVPLAEKLAAKAVGLKGCLNAIERAREKLAARATGPRRYVTERDAHPTPMIRHGAPGTPVSANGSAPKPATAIHDAAVAMCRDCFLRPKGEVVPAWELVEQAAAETCAACVKRDGPALPGRGDGEGADREGGGVTGFDLDSLLEAAVLEGALAEGRDTRLAARQFGASRVIACGTPARERPASQTNRWSPADEAFLREHAGHMGDEELAWRLGWSAVSVHVRRMRRGYVGPTVHPDYITAQGIAKTLGIDVHAVCAWIERGLMAAELAPLADRKIWRVRRSAFYAWALRPANWVYFIRSVRKPERIRDEKLRRLIEKRRAAWGDEWWSIGEVAAYHGVDTQDINRHIRAGRIAAVDWGNWWILRSEATRPSLRFYKGKGAGVFERCGTPAGDAFIVLAAAVGIPYSHISRMMGRSHGGVQPRHANIARRGLIPWLVRAYDLPVVYRSEDGSTWSDWRLVARRFPALARAWAKLGRGEKPTHFERNLMVCVLRKFMAVHYPGSPLARQLGRNGNAREKAIRQAWALYEARPVNPSNSTGIDTDGGNDEQG